MLTIEWPTLINWIVQGFISFSFGLAGGLASEWVKREWARRDDLRQKLDALRRGLLIGSKHESYQQLKRRMLALRLALAAALTLACVPIIAVSGSSLVLVGGSAIVGFAMGLVSSSLVS